MGDIKISLGTMQSSLKNEAADHIGTTSYQASAQSNQEIGTNTLR